MLEESPALSPFRPMDLVDSFSILIIFIQEFNLLCRGDRYKMSSDNKIPPSKPLRIAYNSTGRVGRL
jgi:hypothetical protein